MPGVIGVDEAGRGPVLGSMFVAAVATPDPEGLPDRVADSKRVASDVRRSVAETLHTDPTVTTAAVEVTVAEIDGRDGSLTDLVARAAAAAIAAIDRPTWPAVVDTGEADTDRYEGRLRRFVPDHQPVTARVAADESEPIVAAASIVAKEARERHVARLREEFGRVGSGYPADPTTRDFLASYVDSAGALPACARRSWQTSRDVLAAAEQATFEGFLDRGRSE